MEVEERQGQNFVEALLFLAKHYKTIGNFEEAEHYCTRLLDYTGPVSSLFTLFSIERVKDEMNMKSLTQILATELMNCVIFHSPN
jgi:hypothetical protein